MKLFLVRHGDAVPEYVDTARPLSKDGRQEIEKIAQFLKEKQVKVDLLLTSDKKRAEETADILADGLGFQGPRETRKELGPSAQVLDLLQIVEEAALTQPDWNLMIVGHLPSIYLLAKALLPDSTIPEGLFKTGTAVWLSFDRQQGWTLEDFISPYHLV
ncbi:MAG: phosphohistidine phosphatase SixA [Candidatus Omnitrophota bacterium]